MKASKHFVLVTIKFNRYGKLNMGTFKYPKQDKYALIDNIRVSLAYNFPGIKPEITAEMVEGACQGLEPKDMLKLFSHDKKA